MTGSPLPLVRPPGRSHAGSRGGFTLIELLVVIFVVGLLLVIVLPFTLGGGRHHHYGQLKDSTQVRGILQGMVIWAQNNQDQYPLPSLVDLEDATVPATGTAKDTTSNIYSMLVYNGFVPTEMFVSPAEANGAIEEYRDYQYDSPDAALDPDFALWDPAFHASPMTEHNIATPDNPGDIGNSSYAHAATCSQRRPLWGATFVATEIAIANRGPAISNVQKGQAPNVTFDVDKNSNTLLIHGSRHRWEGNVGYNDNHVNFETSVGPPDHTWDGLTYTDAAGTKWHDIIFYDEPDDPAGTNVDLGIWVVTGDSKKDYQRWLD